MSSSLNCECCGRNSTLEAFKAQYQFLQLNESENLIGIVPQGNEVDLEPIVKNCETHTSIDDFRLVGDGVLEIIYRGEDNVPVSKTVDLSDLAIEAIPISIADTNTIDLELLGSELSAHVRIDPTSTADVSAGPDGLKIDTNLQTALQANDSDSILLTATGDYNHILSADLRFSDSATLDLNVTGSGLVGAVKLSNDANQLIKTDATGLLVDKLEIISLINSVQGVGADTPLVYNPITNTISIPQGDTDTDGYISFVDWNTFNEKLDPSRRVDTISPLQGGGDLSEDRVFSILQSSASQGGYLSAQDWLTFNTKLSPSRIVATTSPLVGGGALTSDLTLSIPAANSTTNGYLTSSDWSLFESKANTGVNVGTGAAIFKQKTAGRNLEFRTIAGTSGKIIVTQQADTVQIDIDPTFTAGDGGGTDLIVKDEGVNLTTGAVSLDFVGSGVTATQNSGNVTITIPGLSNDIDNTSYVDGTYSAQASDAFKVVFLKANTANVVYNIAPASFTKKIIRVYGMLTDSFTATIGATSGTLGGQLTYSLQHNECVTVYSDGTNLFAIAKN